jgi:hypothetical protein
LLAECLTVLSFGGEREETDVWFQKTGYALHCQAH